MSFTRHNECSYAKRYRTTERFSFLVPPFFFLCCNTVINRELILFLVFFMNKWDGEKWGDKKRHLVHQTKVLFFAPNNDTTLLEVAFSFSFFLLVTLQTAHLIISPEGMGVAEGCFEIQ